ncbi:hypothetical protein GF339_04185 [candidate division KSB3 bacterium]|uniref:Uncharacterized protein n=1 Tax=candidate division KSB3 bacterium TaxID=2044937 RepID=A0A9D5Q4Y2_9BACT|nr:hypothetical protein [candidate division KSB3 bacterium]MBD3323758.1 hypothetical protein [candidate division KSB3 bacterium]
MRILKKIIDLYFGRMSQEQKEELVDYAVQKFLEDMSPEEKRQLLEKAIPRLVEGIEIKEVLLQLMATMWTSINTDEERSRVLRAMLKMAAGTGGKISGMIPSRLKNML